MSTRAPSIRRQLAAMVLLTTALVLVISSVATFAYQVLSYRQSAVRHLAVLGDVIALNSTAALAFQNPDDGRSILAALRAEPHILAGALYDLDGRLFAHYPDGVAATELPAAPGPAGFRFGDAHLAGFLPVKENSRQLGFLYLRSDIRIINEQLQLQGGIALWVALAASAVAYGASRRLQRQITDPVLGLAEAAQAVSDRRDYGVRVQQAEGYELGLLTRTFNEMLGRIQDQHSKLHSQLARLHLLQHITRAIGERQDLPSVFRVVLANLEDNLPVDFGCVALYDAPAGTLTVASVGPGSAALAPDLDLDLHATVPVTSEGLARCLAGELVYEPDTGAGSAAFPRRFAGAGLRSLVIAPLMVEGRIFGALLAARHPVQGFESADCEFLRQLSEHVALASHQTQLHEALQQAYDDLRQTQQTVMQQERLRALGQMASGIAHDINNAISPVALYTEVLLERETSLSEQARDYLTTIHRAIEDVAATVARMREFYRDREPTLVLSRIQVNRLVDQVLGLTRARWNDLPQQRGVVIELRKDLAEELPEIMGSESEIRDALTNLVFNAVDAMPEGGTLALRTSRTSQSVGNQSQPRSYVCVDVSDTGVGMDEETRRRCLEPFFTTKGERGTGLGLAMVYGMVQRHGAELAIHSEPGYGTMVRLAFPVSLAGDSTLMEEAPVEVPRKLRILLVDDDPLVIKALRQTLEADGHDVTTTDGGQAGIDAFNAAGAGAGFEVVITDLGMPYVDGRKVAAAIKGSSPGTPVIMLSGWGQRLIAESDVSPHVDRVISKPPRLQDIRAALVELTGKAG